MNGRESFYLAIVPRTNTYCVTRWVVFLMLPDIPPLIGCCYRVERNAKCPVGPIAILSSFFFPFSQWVLGIPHWRICFLSCRKQPGSLICICAGKSFLLEELKNSSFSLICLAMCRGGYAWLLFWCPPPFPGISAFHLALGKFLT